MECYWDFGHALRRSLCSFMLKFSRGDGATYEKSACHYFSCVRITIIGLCGRMPRPKPAPTATAARLAFPSFLVTSPMCTGCRARNPVRWEDVVSLSYAKLSPSASNTLKLQMKKCEIQLHVHVFQSWLSSVLNGLQGPNFYLTVWSRPPTLLWYLRRVSFNSR